MTTTARAAVDPANAGTDFDAVQESWQDELDALVEQWQEAVTPLAREEILAQIEELVADGDTEQLGAITVSAATITVAAALITAAMLSLAATATTAMLAEAASQGATGITPAPLDEAWLEGRSTTTATLLTGGYAATAARAATAHAVPGADPKTVREQVTEHLDTLADRALRDQLGGALSAAQNAGRLAVMEGADQAADFFAVEILDKNTCLHPLTLVTTRRGLVPASEVEGTDELLTHAGRWMPISRTVVTEVREDIVVARLVDGRELRLTSDHPVLTLEGKRLVWRNAGELVGGSFVVDQSSAEHGRKVFAPDLRFRETPDRIPATEQIVGLPFVRAGSQGMPVRTVGLDGKTVVEHEIDHPRAHLDLRGMSDAERLQVLAHLSLDPRLQPASQVAPARAIPAPPGLRGGAPHGLAAKLAGDHHRGPTARLGAMPPPRASKSVPEPPPAARARTISTSGRNRAGPSAVRVSPRVGHGDLEVDLTTRACLADPIPGRPELRPAVGICDGAGATAVDGGSLVTAGNWGVAELACLGRATPEPRGAQGATLAARADLDGSAALRTHLIHDLSVLEVAHVGRELYSGPVYDFTVPEDRTFFADGVLVHNCDPCKEIDGTRFDSLAAATAAYLAGGYVHCSGRERCRGIVVAIWKTGASNTLHHPDHTRQGPTMTDLTAMLRDYQALRARMQKLDGPPQEVIQERDPGWRIERPQTSATADAPADPTRLYLYADIGGMFGVWPDELAAGLRDITGPLQLHLHSPGGDAFDGVAIYNALRHYGQQSGRVHVVVDGLAASAASVIAMAGDKVTMRRGSQLMIHDAWGGAIGPAEDMEKMRSFLDKISDSIAAIYAARAGGTAKQWRTAMRTESWYTDREAVEAGLADELETSVAAAKNHWDLAVFAHAGRSDAPDPLFPGGRYELGTWGSVMARQKPDFAKGGHIPAETPAQAAARMHAAAQRAATTQTPDATPATGPTSTEGAVNMPFDRDKIREALGLGPDATDQQVQEAWATAHAPAPAPVTPTPATPDHADLSALAASAQQLGVIMIDPGQLQQMQQMAARGQAAYDAQRRNERDQYIQDALMKGKVALSRKEHWEKAWDADPEGTRAMLDGLAPNMVPMEADGYSNSVATSEAEATLFNLYPEMKPQGGGRRG